MLNMLIMAILALVLVLGLTMVICIVNVPTRYYAKRAMSKCSTALTLRSNVATIVTSSNSFKKLDGRSGGARSPPLQDAAMRR